MDSETAAEQHARVAHVRKEIARLKRLRDRMAHGPARDRRSRFIGCLTFTALQLEHAARAEG